ncbi:MAG: YdcF family protein [Candidatus Berkelbacteria bacterium]|nr:YdcF family protein [Candidatus Berkelbacteria bacterium]MCR4307554.1 YdcF family protein [Candidatus Berkelbacteria bacterium]
MKYDAILVFGRGVYKDGSTSESAKSTVEEAVKLYDSGQADKIIFSGKWTYTLDYTPPTTEARAMANYAKNLGLPEKAILLEEEAYTTVTNAYFIKKKFLIPNNWTRIALVSVYPMGQRALWTLELVLGPDYNCELINTDFSFPPEILKEKESKEKEKRECGLELCKLHSLKPGDHETIFRVTEEDLNKNWRPR